MTANINALINNSEQRRFDAAIKPRIELYKCALADALAAIQEQTGSLPAKGATLAVSSPEIESGFSFELVHMDYEVYLHQSEKPQVDVTAEFKFIG